MNDIFNTCKFLFWQLDCIVTKHGFNSIAKKIAPRAKEDRNENITVIIDESLRIFNYKNW